MARYQLIGQFEMLPNKRNYRQPLEWTEHRDATRDLEAGASAGGPLTFRINCVKRLAEIDRVWLVRQRGGGQRDKSKLTVAIEFAQESRAPRTQAAVGVIQDGERLKHARC
jgi:hypothetical protein